MTPEQRNAVIELIDDTFNDPYDVVRSDDTLALLSQARQGLASVRQSFTVRVHATATGGFGKTKCRLPFPHLVTSSCHGGTYQDVTAEATLA